MAAMGEHLAGARERWAPDAHGPAGADGDAPGGVEGRRLPPVTPVGMTSLGLIIAGGIYLSSYLPRHVPLGPAVALLIASALLVGVNLVSLARVPGFAWRRFFEVARWVGLAYVVIAGMIEYAFVRNHIHGGALVVLTLSLLVFAAQGPTMVGFTVARFHRSEPATD
jgi:hypothetical protein